MTIVACLLLAAIPAVGAVLAIALAVTSILFWGSRPLLDRWSYQPVAPKQYVDLPLPYSQEVVGESHYQAEIKRLVLAFGRHMYATLTHEEGNPHDPNAVRVDLLYVKHVVTCGYLPRTVAPAWVQQVRQAAERGDKFLIQSFIRGGYGDAPNYGVWLGQEPSQVRPLLGDSSKKVNKRSPRFRLVEEIDPGVRDFWSSQSKTVPEDSPRVRAMHVQAPDNPLSLIVAEGTSCAVAGVSYWVNDDEREALDVEVFYLRREPANKHDANAVAVYAGDRKFGYLSQAMAARYAPLLDRLEGPFVVARDLSRKRVSLLMPRVAELRALLAE